MKIRNSSSQLFIGVIMAISLLVSADYKILSKYYGKVENQIKLSILLIFGILIIVSIYKLTKKYMKEHLKNQRYREAKLYKIDTMSGLEFENLLHAHFKKLGYTSKVTKASHDFGADLILKSKTDTIVIQAKRYNEKVNLSAVQEILGALHYYNATKGYVITNSFFRPSAIKLANASGIILWNRWQLLDLIKAEKKEKLLDTEDFGFCPKCSEKIVLKNGKNGLFKACSGFPKCKYTENYKS